MQSINKMNIIESLFQNNDIFISILIPCYNAEKYIFKAIDSVLASSFCKHCELVLINDGSTDSTEQIIKKYLISEKNILYYKTANLGVSNARNVGITLSHGKYITFLDADDEYGSTMLESVYCSVITYDLDGGLCYWTKNHQKLYQKRASYIIIDKKKLWIFYYIGANQLDFGLLFLNVVLLSEKIYYLILI